MVKDKKARPIKHRQLFGFLQKKILNFTELDKETREKELQLVQAREIAKGKGFSKETFEFLKSHVGRYKIFPSWKFGKKLYDKPVLMIRSPDNRRFFRLVKLEE